MTDGIRPTPIHVKGGEPYAHPVYFLNDDRTVAAVAGDTVRAQIRPYPGADELTVEFSTDMSAWTTLGLVVLTLTAAQADVVADRYSVDDPGVMDFQVTRGGIPYTYMRAAVTAEPDVTR
jgi:hypothetical protein